MNATFDVSKLGLSTPDKSALESFVRAWFDHENPVLFAGAGLPRYNSQPKADLAQAAQFSDWNELVNDLRDQLAGTDGEVRRSLPSDPLRLAQVYETHVGRAALLDAIAKHVPVEDRDPGPAYERLARINWHAIVTTNYDDLLERAFHHRRLVRKIIWDSDLTQRRTPSDLPIIKMHGDLADRESIVFAEEDYRTYERRRPGMAVKIRQLLLEHPLLFVGFSLSDPNATSIDGWIRDTVGEVRLPAIAILHGPPFPAEAQMWKKRGVHMIVLPWEVSLQSVFEALENTSRAPAKRPDAGRKRAAKIVEEMNSLVQNRASNQKWAEQTAALLAKLVDDAVALGPRGNEDGEDYGLVSEASRCASWFCYGNLFSDYVDMMPMPVDHTPIFDAFDSGKKKTFLSFALSRGTQYLQLRKPEQPINIAELLLTEYGEHLTLDEKAQIHYDRACILRDLGDMTAAERDLGKARELASSVELRTEISIEMVAIHFACGNADGLRRELARPLEQEDALSRCRRGSIALMLQQPEEARDWYNRALQRARTEDERYVALWGLEACQTRGGGKWGVEEDTFRQEALAIRAEDRPVSESLWELTEKAGQRLLDGNRAQAIAHLKSFLERAQRLGWPLTVSHSVRFPMEIAVTQAVRLLLTRVENESPPEARNFRDGLTLLSQFGVGREVRELVRLDVLEQFATQPENREWLRRFALHRGGIRKQDDVRQMCALVGLPLLDDSAIDSVVIDFVHLTRLAGNTSVFDEARPDLLDDAWKLISRHGEHLAEDSVHSVCSILPLGGGGRAPVLASEMSVWPWQSWKRLGFFSRSAIKREFHRMAGELRKGLTDESLPDDWIRHRHILSLSRDLNRASLLTAIDKRSLLNALRHLAGRVPTKARNRTLLLEVVHTLHEFDCNAIALKGAAKSLLALHDEEVRSSQFPYWCEIMADLTPLLDATDTTLLAQYAQRAVSNALALQPDDDSWTLKPFAIGRLIHSLAAVSAGRKALGGASEIIESLLRLGSRDPRVLSFTSDAILLRDKRLSNAVPKEIRAGLAPWNKKELRTHSIQAIGMLASPTSHPDAVTSLISELLPLMRADHSDIRYAAAHAVWQVRATRRAQADVFADAILGTSFSDPEWSVRAVALSSASDLFIGTRWQREALNAASRLTEDFVAAVRHFAIMAVKDLS